MTTVHLILRDTDDGLVDVETTITGFDRASNAQRMADELNAYLAHQHKQQWAALLSDKPDKPEIANQKDTANAVLNQLGIPEAMRAVCQALREDPDYAWSWHCNIAMSAYDAGCPVEVANEGAARFLEILAGVNTRNHPGFNSSRKGTAGEPSDKPAEVA